MAERLQGEQEFIIGDNRAVVTRNNQIVIHFEKSCGLHLQIIKGRDAETNKSGLILVGQFDGELLVRHSETLAQREKNIVI